MELPAGPITEILLRLPVKSLLRFKSVCRSWRTLIEDPYFIADHLKRSSSEGSSTRFLLCTYYSDTDTKWLISLLSAGDLELSRRVEAPRVNPFGYFRVIGSSNGIVCLSSGSGISLLNPATREFRLLQEFSGHTVSIGFGYSRMICDHKLIRIASVGHSDHLAHVFTLKDGMWREVPGSDCCIIYKFDGTVANEIVYWIAYSGGQKRSEVILSFNLGDDKFSQQALPEIGEADGDSKSLSVFEKSLRLVVYSRAGRDRCLNIWVRNSGDVWTRLARIEPAAVGVHMPVGWGAEQVIFLENSSGRLVSFNVTTGRFREIRIDAQKLPIYFNFHLYVESLLSLTR